MTGHDSEKTKDRQGFPSASRRDNRDTQRNSCTSKFRIAQYSQDYHSFPSLSKQSLVNISMLGLLKSPMVARAERFAVTSFQSQCRTLIVPLSPSTSGRRRGQKRVFVPRASLAAPKGSRKPTMLEAKALPLSFQEMDNSALATLANLGEHGACKEMLKRHIMDVDSCSYDEASEKYKQIAKKNLEGAWLLSVPYRIGIATALIAGFGSIPMVFDLGTAQWFNEYFVTTDVPDEKDIETFLEVGSWTWNWMEPPLGQISFLLLCLQYSRSQMDNLGIKPYTTRVKRMRAKSLTKNFPQYDAGVLMMYSLSSKMVISADDEY